MLDIQRDKPVMITGATGYVAGWIVKKLLEAGLTVHAPVRNPEKVEKVEYLEELAESEFQDFSDPHASLGHKFQHKAVTFVRGPEDNLVNRVLINDLPLDGWRTLEDLLNDYGIAGVGQGGQTCIDTEVVEL